MHIWECRVRFFAKSCLLHEKKWRVKVLPSSLLRSEMQQTKVEDTLERHVFDALRMYTSIK